jgi:hypothetical protein
LLGACGKTSNPPADLILANGPVHTLANAPSTATAIAIAGDRVVYVGNDAGAGAFRGERTRWVDLEGKTVLPGLVDAHGHLSNLGRSLEEVELVGSTSRDDVRQRVLAAQANAAPDQWLHGRGWDQNDWVEVSFPTWRDLAGTEANPVYLERRQIINYAVITSSLGGFSGEVPFAFIFKRCKGEG